MTRNPVKNSTDIGNFELFSPEKDFFDQIIYQEIEVPEGFFDDVEFEEIKIQPQQTQTLDPGCPAVPTDSNLQETSSIIQSHQKCPTFINASEERKENFIQKMKNINTSKKTESSIKQFKRWLEDSHNDKREIWNILPVELDNLIGSFLLSIRKADGSEYEPDTLTTYHRGIDRFLRENRYPFSLEIDREFDTSRQILAAKRIELVLKASGNRPNAAEPLSVHEMDQLRDMGLTGTDSPKKLINLLCLNNTILFGVRGGTENRKLCWGDIKLKTTDQGREYLEFNERIAKTRTSERTTQTSAFHQKQFSHETEDTCPVYAYKIFAKHRPVDMCLPDSPFYLCINHRRSPGSDKWFSSQPLGSNSLKSIMKVMVTQCGLKGKKN